MKSGRDLVPPFGPPDPTLLRVFRAAAFADDQFDQALMRAFPAPNDSGRQLHEQHIPSSVVRHIASLLFLLSSLSAGDGEQMRLIIEAHNARMQDMLADDDRLMRWGLTRPRFENAVFTKAAADNAVANIKLHRRLALDGTTFARLLAPQANRTAVFEALDVLRVAGALRTLDGAYNSKIYVSVGTLEEIVATYLVRLRDGINEASRELV